MENKDDNYIQDIQDDLRYIDSLDFFCSKIIKSSLGNNDENIFTEKETKRLKENHSSLVSKRWFTILITPIEYVKVVEFPKFKTNPDRYEIGSYVFLIEIIGNL